MLLLLLRHARTRARQAAPILPLLLLPLLLLLACLSPSPAAASDLHRLEQNINHDVNKVDFSSVFSLAENVGVSYSLAFVSASDTTINTNMASTYRMRLENGTSYRCGVVGPDAADAPRQRMKRGATKQSLVDMQRVAREVIDGMGAWCATKTEGFWTYEYCYGGDRAGGVARQFHVVQAAEVQLFPAPVVDVLGKTDFVLGRDCVWELGKGPLKFDPLQKGTNGGRGKGDVLALGYFDGMTERTDRPRPSGIPAAAVSDAKYVWDACGGGETCEFAPGWAGYGTAVHGKPRETQVRYGCGPSEKPVLVDVQEPSSCRYVFDVRFKALCDVGGLVGDVLPVRQIECWEDEKTSGKL